MAAATQEPPAKSVVKQKRPEPEQYIFRLTKKHPEYYEKSSPFTARLSLVNQDEIYWPYINDQALPWDDGTTVESIPKEAVFHPRRIRYISGANTIFVDEQERNNDTYKLHEGKNRFLDNDNNKSDIEFKNHGEIRADRNKRTLRNYLWANNQCLNQFPMANDRGDRFKKVETIYRMIDFVNTDIDKVALGELREKAYELARTARTKEMLPHAKFLNIMFSHDGTNYRKDDAAIKQDYIDYALANPAKFLSSYNDPKVKVIYQIKELLENGDITFGKVQGQAHWLVNGTFITQLPPDKDPTAYLAEFSMTKDGEEFANNLRGFIK